MSLSKLPLLSASAEQARTNSSLGRYSYKLTSAVAATAFLMLGTTSLATAGSGGSSSVDSLLEIEAQRRAQLFEDAMTHFDAGVAAYEENNCESAVAEFSQAYELMPDSPRTMEHLARLKAWYCTALVCRAEELAIDEARYAEAIQTAGLAVQICPENAKAKTVLARLEDPTDPSSGERGRTPEYLDDVQEVIDLLALGESQVRIGLYDEAEETYHRVIAIDPYNSTARRGLETVARERQKHYEVAYGHTRVQLLQEVVEEWSLPVPVGVDRAISPTSIAKISNDGGELRNLLENIRLSVEFNESSLEDVVDYLRTHSSFHTEDRTPINFILDLNNDAQNIGSAAPLGFGEEESAFEASYEPVERLVNLQLNDVSMIDLLEFVTEQTDTTYTFERGIVVIRSGGGAGIITESFEVPPDFIESLLGGGGSSGGSSSPFGQTASPFAPASTPAQSGGGGSRTAKAALEAAGIDFSTPGSSASFNRTLSRLQVTVTAEQMAEIEEIIYQIRIRGPKLIHITTRFVEVQQQNEDELGFDWLLGQFNLPGSSRAFGGGGVAGNGVPIDGTNYPFVFPNSQGTPVGVNPVGRLRTGDTAIRRGAIDGLLNAATAATATSVPAPGIFSIAGVFTDPQFQLVVRALNQSTGVDLMTAPSIVTTTGQTGKIEVVREFIYPGDYDPPELPNNVGVDNNNNNGGGLNPGLGGFGQITSFPVTPATPRDWTTRPVGVILDVTPNVSADSFTITMDLNPQVVEFEGFVNYGNPIQSPALNSLGQPVSVTITENRILQPIFSSRKVETLVSIYDGSTVAIGGLMREDVQQIEDKVPLLGDIPILGRLFQSRAESHFKRNLIVFVTAKLIGPDGMPLQKESSSSSESSIENSSRIGSGAEELFQGEGL